MIVSSWLFLEPDPPTINLASVYCRSLSNAIRKALSAVATCHTSQSGGGRRRGRIKVRVKARARITPTAKLRDATCCMHRVQSSASMNRV